MADDFVKFPAALIHETDTAYLLDTAEGEIWFPKSVTIEIAIGVFEVPYWLAKERGII